ncbi:MAG: hypothetical protein QOF39_272 [Frankiales bacterium]|nr:hypothetical protein [Frankiales bacterium]
MPAPDPLGLSTSAATLNGLIRAADLTGVFASGLLGGAIARTERLDPVGFAVLAILSSLGGGLIRDTLLQHGTPVALTDYTYLVTAIGAAAVAFLVRFEGQLWERFFPVLDALALGAWAAVGAQKTLHVGLGWLPAVLLGTITAVGGGMVRDIAVLRVPRVFGGNTLYATCAVAASAVMVALNRADHPTAGILAATAVGATMCLLARRRGWSLPSGSTDSWRDRLENRRLAAEDEGGR